MAQKENNATDARTAEARLPVYPMPVDLYETADGLVLLADLPGVRRSDLQVRLEQGVLTVEGVAHSSPDAPGQTPLALEFRDAVYRRTFTVGSGIDPSRIDASLQHGVLTLRLPKAEAARTRKIEIRTEGN
jgi:HSP20 family molecular chaperone IbpA